MTYARETALASFDTPLADRQSIDLFIDVWTQLGEDIAQHGRDIDAARDAHRADCLERYGRDIFAGESLDA